jgi:Thioredoxin like C-terminal domain
VRAEVASPEVTTPESYLGAARAERFVTQPVVPGVRSFSLPRDPLPPDHLAYGGTWRLGLHGATAVDDATLELDFGARRVFLVMGSRGRPRRLRVLLDGRPISDAKAGDAVVGGSAVVSRQRLYRLVELPEVGRHMLRLRFQRGISGYAFTFG